MTDSHPWTPFLVAIAFIVGFTLLGGLVGALVGIYRSYRTIQRDRPQDGPVAAGFRGYPITAVIIGICVVNFLLLNLSGEPLKQAILRILAPPPFLIWGGAVWGLATSAFVHLAWWHILFNMLALEISDVPSSPTW